MASTLTLVSRPALPRETFDSLIDHVGKALPLAADAALSVQHSAERMVARVRIENADSTALRIAAQEAFDAYVATGALAAADACVTVVDSALTDAPRMLLLMDVDSTLIKQEVIELLAAHAGREEEVAAVTEAAMRGELDFAQSLIQRVATLKDLPETVLSEVIARVVYSDGARELVQRFHAAGHLVGVVSGGFQQILDPLAAELKLDHALANTLGITAGLLDGTVHGQIVDRAMKEKMLRAWAAEHGIGMEATIAAGDGANDLDMVNAAGLGVAFNAKPALREQAGARIDFGRLDVIADLVLDDLAA
ncbi:phosphoserine phosphatase SerB [Arthrobacter sp. MYb211]|uniref:phosphoserine phosphatase SerB n=1 Tax=unclassified Arthrobacter TaxID=235627 RepID=UPI000CFB808F|nr:MULTISPECIES: phosphoserine phosphatase SerB [unclassified Arthrobacter]PRA13951.1 phosphoserine phosphatase SerB [Arthrobacter sp. MYb221]PRC09322.1 phosphoserine phosphatase SerB [Arthrobacter sp. MYb211]